MPLDPNLTARGGAPKPVNGDTGWNELTKTLSRTVPARLHYTQRITFKIRALRGRG